MPGSPLTPRWVVALERSFFQVAQELEGEPEEGPREEERSGDRDETGDPSTRRGARPPG